MRETEDGDGVRERQREKDRQTDTQTDRQTYRQRRQEERETDGRERQVDIEAMMTKSQLRL